MLLKQLEIRFFSFNVLKTFGNKDFKLNGNVRKMFLEHIFCWLKAFVVYIRKTTNILQNQIYIVHSCVCLVIGFVCDF